MCKDNTHTTMKSIFSELPDDIISLIIQIENDRKKEELLTKRKYREVIQELNKLSGRHCDLDEGYRYGWPWVPPTRGNDITDLVAEFFDDI